MALYGCDAGAPGTRLVILNKLRLLLGFDAVEIGAAPEAGTAATMVAEVSTMVTPSMLEDFREWRKNAKPEDREALEQWIAALIASLK